MSLPPCDPEVFQNGESLLAVDTYQCGRAAGFEKWVQTIARVSGQRVDWHYSGGIAHVLYLGDRSKIEDAMKKHPCPGRVMRVFAEADPGLYRGGVTEVPDGAISAFYEGGAGSTFIVGTGESVGERE